MSPNNKTIVNSWNEWDPMKRVILGRADGTVIQAPEPAMERDFRRDDIPVGMYGRLPEEVEEKGKEELDNFAKILEKRGIRVDRPTPIDFSQQVQTPDWVNKTSRGCMPPRDVLLPVGNEILEATMSLRSRWYEYLCYRPILEQYYKEDKNMRWEAAPKPRLTERTYKKNFWKEWRSLSPEQQLERAKNKEWAITEFEPLFDAADVARLGKDLFVQRSTVTNYAGIDWLRRHFPNHRIHAVTFNEIWPVHLDATFVPLRPGLVLQNYQRFPHQKELPELLKKNGWESVECAKPAHARVHKFGTSSPFISMNILMLDPKTVCVEECETAQMEQFNKLGFEVIPVPYWDVAPFGGSLHCSTVDVYREGKLEDYFPKQVAGF